MDLLERVVRVETILWNVIERELAQRGTVGLGTLLALRALGRYDGAGRVNDLSRDLGITIGAASKIVDRLERSGLALRRPHPEDGRSSLVALTPEGDRSRLAADEIVGQLMTEMFDDPREVAAAVSVLTSMQGRLDEVRA